MHGVTVSTLSLCVGIAAGAAQADDRPDVCRLFEPAAEYVEQIIDMQLEKVEHRLRIPKIYFDDPWDRVNGERYTSQLISVAVDDFAPVYRPMTLTYNKVGRRDGYFHFLIGDHVAFKELLEIQFQYAAPSSDSTAAEAVRASSDFGLTALVPAEGRLYRDLYVGGKSEIGNLSILVYNRPEYSPFPQCKHYTRTHDMDVIISYDRQLLPRWSDLETKVASFIGCAAANPL